MRINDNKEIKFSNNRSWLTKELKKPRAQRLIKAYVAQMLNGTIDFKQLGNIYRPTEKIPEASVKRLFRYQETKDMINEELQNTLISKDVTLDYLIDKRKEVIDLAKDKERLDIMLKGVEGFEDMYNMREQRKEVKQISQEISYKELLQDGSKKEILAKQTEEIPQNSDKIAESGKNE